jgi:hypothetical protein
MRFLVMLSAKPNITLSNVQLIAENLNSIFEEFSGYAVKIVKELCSQLGINLDNFAVLEACHKLECVRNVLSGLNTAYKREKWMEKSGYFVKAHEITLGTHEIQRYSSSKRTNCSVIEEDTYQLVFLDELLTKILENATFQMLFRQQSGENVEFLKEFRHGLFCRNHSFLQLHPDAIVFHFVVDAYETANVLGSHTSVHKIEALYCLIRNLPQELMSRTCNIFTIGLWNAKYVKQYGYNQILMPLFSQLKQLESANGLEVIVHGQKTNVHGILGMFSADNLGAHSLFGFLESFSANYFCRFCMAHKDSTQTHYLASQFDRRTREHVDSCVAQLGSASYNPSLTGIKRSCILNDLAYFHSTEQSTVDCMHDVLEGIIPYEVGLILQSLIDMQLFSIDNINDAIIHFNYSHSDMNSKPSVLSLPVFGFRQLKHGVWQEIFL